MATYGVVQVDVEPRVVGGESSFDVEINRHFEWDDPLSQDAISVLRRTKSTMKFRARVTQRYVWQHGFLEAAAGQAKTVERQLWEGSPTPLHRLNALLQDPSRPLSQLPFLRELPQHMAMSNQLRDAQGAAQVQVPADHYRLEWCLLREIVIDYAPVNVNEQSLVAPHLKDGASLATTPGTRMVHFPSETYQLLLKIQQDQISFADDDKIQARILEQHMSSLLDAPNMTPDTAWIR